MDVSVNISKITPPYLPQILYRPRLLNLIEANKEKKLILILGQAAQGKTTLAASYGKASNIPLVWVNVDRNESDPISLFYLIVQSLQHALKEINFPYLLSYPSQIMGPREEIPLYREWAQSIFKEVSIPIQIVMDGLDRLFADAPSFKFLQALVEDSPPNIHLMLLSREIPPPVLEFQHLKIRQQALVLTNEDLAFSQDETKKFFKKVRGISLDADQLKKIHSATEGWVGGLILLSESLLKLSDVSREKYIAQELPGFFNKEIFQYFGKEILSSQPKEVQQFLLKSSMMDIIEPSFAKEVFEIENSEGILREHVRKNLFVQSFYDEKKGWLFRYHHMFRNFLRSKYLADTNAEERYSLNLKIGNLFKQRGELENSTKYFLEAKAYHQAASVIERFGMDLLQKGRGEDLSRWLLALPEDSIQDNPWLLFYLAMTKRFLGGRENLIALQKAHTLFKQEGDMRGTLISLAHLIERFVQTGIHLAPIEGLIEEGEAVLQQLESNEYPYERAVLWYSIGLGRILGEGDIRKGIWACQNAYSISKQLGDISLQAYALCFSAFGFVLLGEFSLADEARKKIEKVAEKSVYPEFNAIQLTVQCLLANHRGDFGKAEILVQKLQEEIEKHGFVYMVPWAYEISGYLRAAEGEFSEAEKIGKQYLNTALSMENSLLKGLAYRLLGLIYLHQKDFKKAREAINQSIHVFSTEAASKYHLNRAKIKLAMVCTHLKEYKMAEKALDEALQYFSSISSHISLAEIHLATAFLLYDQRKNADAAAHLRTGFKIAEDKKYEYLYNFGKKYLMKACLLALELKVEGAIDYAAYLLATRLSSVAEEKLKKLSNHPDSRVKEKAWEIRRKIHRSKAPPLRIETLGTFRLFHGGSLMEEDEWDRSQPKKLLKTIISYGDERVPKEIIIDELWPDESPSVAERNFKTTLQRLRKSLEPFILKDFGSSYIHLHNNIVFLDQELCHVDANRFSSLLKMAEEKGKRGDWKGAFSFYAEALEIYKGDFLPEELYAPWPDKKREELRAKYIELLNKMAKFHEKQGAMRKAVDCYKKAIQIDPLIEESYQKLMTFYSSKGAYNEALRMYEECKKALKKGLKSRPDETTDAIHKKIMERISTSLPPARKGPEIEKMRRRKV
jgi:ATP/maltotriose-dependent transcriptional regulator MalT/DNA-binding SARP family transcriptional activator